MKANVYPATYDASYIHFQKIIIFSTYARTHIRDRKHACVPLLLSIYAFQFTNFMCLKHNTDEIIPCSPTWKWWLPLGWVHNV